MMSFQKKDTIYTQGDSTDGLFFIQRGKVRLSVVSERGKEATLAILGERDFFGESGLAGQLLRTSSATAITFCIVLHVEKNAMMLAMGVEPKLSAIFGNEGASEMSVPRLSQETLAEMVGTTRSRVSFFMNRFRKLGFINYDVGDNLHVHNSLLNVVLKDEESLVTPDTAKRNVRNKSLPKPPSRHGGPPDDERAKRPPLPSVKQRSN